MRKLLQSLQGLQRDELGVSSMEYAVLAGIIVVAVVAAGSVLSNTTNGLPGLFTNLLTTVNAAAQGTTKSGS
ncbi:Flp family type IVb pilin [Trinickia acidisoli]|uniref:Flp family type IVb pilin n=1 Tax=Trinickia acidisoli TaxID=2767482 RepID=UPI001A909035|nr:Flp family type IVb pilin [Trinickia acidisoli]